MATPHSRPKALRSIWRSLSGFTLIELLIAIAVLAVILAIGVPYYTTMIVKARETAAVAVVTQWPTAQALFYMDNRRYASSLDELNAGGYVPPANSARLGYTFEITQSTAQAPPQDQTMLALAVYRPEETWWERIGLVKYAWANHKDKHKDKGKDKDKDEEEEQTAAPPSPCGGTSSGGALEWQGYADPIDARPRHFYIDHTKTIRFAKGRRATRCDPVVKDNVHPG